MEAIVTKVLAEVARAGRRLKKLRGPAPQYGAMGVKTQGLDNKAGAAKAEGGRRCALRQSSSSISGIRGWPLSATCCGHTLLCDRRGSLCRSPPTGDRPMSLRITSAGSFDAGRPARLVRRSNTHPLCARLEEADYAAGRSSSSASWTSTSTIARLMGGGQLDARPLRSLRPGNPYPLTRAPRDQ
jgi:hypothetical protein